ncbi:hypothetical protein [Leptospira licerasiae]|uniref:hypothetical protein n=1 Tax=Leptospira licerasiae TaxID=447106 RepID=UPI001084285B|nr:hypothetical protein [Leptospira licerasiae]TGM85377.1 hypothetical protein EHR05_19460 [Leptospira licerasiae]
MKQLIKISLILFLFISCSKKSEESTNEPSKKQQPSCVLYDDRNFPKHFISGCLGRDSDCFDITQESRGLIFYADGKVKSDGPLGVSENLFLHEGKWDIKGSAIEFRAYCGIMGGNECFGACLYERKLSEKVCIKQCGLADNYKKYGKPLPELTCDGTIALNENQIVLKITAIDRSPKPGFSILSKSIVAKDFCFFKLAEPAN